jgi:hypothetical protein
LLVSHPQPREHRQHTVTPESQRSSRISTHIENFTFQKFGNRQFSLRPWPRGRCSAKAVNLIEGQIETRRSQRRVGGSKFLRPIGECLNSIWTRGTLWLVHSRQAVHAAFELRQRCLDPERHEVAEVGGNGLPMLARGRMHQQQPPAGVVPGQDIALDVELLQQIGAPVGAVVHQLLEAAQHQDRPMIGNRGRGHGASQFAPHVDRTRRVAVGSPEQLDQIHFDQTDRPSGQHGLKPSPDGGSVTVR